MGRFILAIDQGTTSSRAVLFDESANLKGIAQMPFEQHFPSDGWVEHSPDEIWRSVVQTVRDVVEKNDIDVADIACIGITNQRETTVVWEKSSGAPIYPAIVWQDRRTAGVCAKMRSEGLEPEVVERTGLLLDPYFSATKIAWILDHVDGARQRAEKGEILFGTIDTYLLWKLTRGQSHKTDATNASRTLLFNIREQCFDDTLLDMFDVPRAMLPEVLDTVGSFGSTSLLGGEIPVTAMVGDQQGALMGQCCFEDGSGKVTYGTGGFLMVNTGSEMIRSKNRLLSTVAYRLDGRASYAVEGSIFVAGAAVNWLKDLGFFENPRETGALASKADPRNGVVVVPAFTGFGAPHWDPDARGAIFGLTRDSGIREIVAATLESIAFQTADLLGAMARDGAELTELRVDGGMAANDWYLEVLANVLGLKVLRQSTIETTVLGACYLAGLGAGVIPSLDALRDNWRLDRQFEPGGNRDLYGLKYLKWKEKVAKVLT